MSEERGPAALSPGDASARMDRDRLIAGAFVRLADTLVDEFDVVDFLHGLSAYSVRILDAEAAGVMPTT